jgi:glycosyltransferase involved in cell wall biosynthesis
MRIAVYAIALNEEKHVARWAQSAADADLILLADTGSTDSTVELAKSLGVEVADIRVTPWRFDDARNAALAALPSDIDYCIALDLDEVLVEGWRAELERATTTRPRYTYTWSWQDDGRPGLQYSGDKIHARAGYHWRHPVHEVITPYGITETQEGVGLEIHHLPDSSKGRDYLPLLALSVAETPEDDRNAFYYARELLFANQTTAAAREFRRHLSLKSARWIPERAASYRYLAQIEPECREAWLERAIKEDPSRREGHVMLAAYYFDHKRWEECLTAALSAVAISEKPLDYLCEAWAWSEYPWDLAAHAAYQLGLLEQAQHLGQVAVSLAPNNERLANDLKAMAL